MGDYRLTVTTAPDGRTRLGITKPGKLAVRTFYVDMDKAQTEQVAMNLLSRAMMEPS